MSDERAAVTVWRVRLMGRIAAVGLLCLWVAMTLGITIGADTTSAALAIMWVTTIGIGLAAWRWAYVPYIALEPDEVTVQNRLLRYSIPYRDISSVRAGYGGITLVMSDGPQDRVGCSEVELRDGPANTRARTSWCPN